jgi:molybdopterin-guanine dinucleotide biosynthesis protein A
MLLLTGGASTRFGSPKHLQPHPEGGTWASYLVDLFQEAIGHGPIRILGEPVPGRPQCKRLDDPREGPARALARWATGESEELTRWWVVACDQVRWDIESLALWHSTALGADPGGEAWVMAEIDGEAQPLGGFLGGGLLPALRHSKEQRLLGLARSLSCRILLWEARPFQDLDDPDSFQAWVSERRFGISES